MKKLLSLVTALVLTGCLVLAGCASDEPPMQNSTPPAASGTPNSEPALATGGKITVYQNKSEIQDDMLQLAKDYQSETGVEVEVWQSAGDDHYQNLKTYLSSESGPTVFTANSLAQMNEIAPYLADVGGLPFMGSINEDLKGKTGGVVVGVPMTAEGFGLVYNKSLYDPSEINSTQALVSFIQSSAASGVQGIGLSQEAYFLIGHILNTPFALQSDPAAFCQQVYSGEVNIADVAEFQELAEILVAIRDNQTNPMEVTYDANCGDFMTGKTAAIHQGNWVYSMFNDYEKSFEIGLAGLPISGNTAIPVGVPYYWCVNSDASEEEQALAMDFLTWMYTSETGIRYQMEVFDFIPVSSDMESPSDNPLNIAVGDAIAAGDIMPWTFNTEWPAGIIETYLSPVAEEFFISSMSGAELLSALNAAFVEAAGA